jgi:hypothetical protein
MNRSRTCWASAFSLVLVAACSSGSKDGGPAGNASCTTSQLQILFTPMFSAFDGGAHPFKVPAVVDNIDPAAVKWSASDPEMVDIVNDVTLGGVMISPRKSGTVSIIATAGDQCGTSLLTITQATPEDWMVGNMRYNNGVVLTGPVGGGRQNPDAAPAQKDFACTNCHGDTATTNMYRTVSHTPQQTGGFSDDDLLSIFTKGMVPIGGYFDSSVVNYNTWRQFHTWQMTPQEAKGIIVYLRSLTPQAQAGSRADFGGRRGDGGMGGVPPAPMPPREDPDAGTATD